jgi:peptide-methionine (S)-S-oxide reductase
MKWLRYFDYLRSPLLLVLRLFIGWQFFQTGKGKLEHLDRVTTFFASLHIPMPHLNAIFVGTLETVGGLLLILGLASRLIAVPLTINMIVAYLTADRDAIAHVFTNPDGFTQAEPFLFLLVSLIVLAFGPGFFSLDEVIARRRGKASGAQRVVLAAVALMFFGAAAPAPVPAAPPPRGVATFAGGCFWCEESAFQDVKGVISAVSGYTGGKEQNPTYEQVSDHETGHRESVDVIYDPRVISYQQLLDIFWHNVDPFDNAGQFCDKGPQYRGAIFYHDAEQKRLADVSKAAVEKRFGKKVFTDVLPASKFWPAEDYHQDYYKKNPVRYHFYRFNCGRDARLKEIWGSDAGGEH